MLAEKTLAAIDKEIFDNQEMSFRRHLGASVVGAICERSLWYKFRWAKEVKHKASLLRLFDRGHKEEDRFIAYLHSIGCQVWSHDEKGEQFKIADCNGHFGGSLDSVIKGIPELPNTPILGEYKTHGDKYFKQLVRAASIREANIKHFVQMQIYMYKYHLSHGLYMAVNKNTDELYLEIIELDTNVAEVFLKIADEVIFAKAAKHKLWNNATYYKCKMCDYTDICHSYEIGHINCRTCAHSTPVDNAMWKCELFDCTTVDHVAYLKDKEVHATGCENHMFLPDMIGSGKLIRVDPGKNFIEIKMKGKTLKHGPRYMNSWDLVKKYSVI